MRSLKLALLASCLAFPALAQEIPPAGTSAEATARTDAERSVADAQAKAHGNQARASAQANLQGNTTATATVPSGMPPAVIIVSPNKPMTRKEAVGVAVAQRWIQKFQTPHLDGDGVVHFQAGKGQIAVVAAVDHITDIALAPGETVFPPLHVGDAGSWKFHPAMSRSGSKAISHVLVKPTDAGLSTNLVIETNKRTISVSLTSRQRDYMPLVSLDLPEEEDADFTAYASKLAGGGGGSAPINLSGTPASPCDQAPTVPPDQFSISGAKVAWRPTQVYQVATDVGIKTCVDFPSSIGSLSLPVLLALADDGGWFSGPTKTVVNVRFVNRRFIVDEMLDRFVLVDGVGGNQKKITVVRKGL